MSSAIAVSDLHVSYKAKRGRRVEAVSGLSFEVAPGEIVGFLGPNGAGKSSTLKAIMGFVKPDAGTCEVFGESCADAHSRARIGYLPEVALYYPYLTPLETLTLYGELQGLKGPSLRNQAEELLEALGIASAARKQNRQLSKGMLQRVGIAQSLLGTPDLLILDEVTSGLDPVGRRELRELLRDKQKQGVTLFFSSHELAEVELLCDRILLIHKGRLIEERNVEALKDELRQFEVTYSGDVSLRGITEHVFATADATTRARFEDKQELIEAIELIQNSGGTILDVIATEGSLENYFIDTIGRAA